MAKVSVIIAVYKAEEFIERCVRSLFGQTLGDMEFIFVDDCSPDRSIDVMLRVLEEYPRRKPQVKVIRHERNRGVSVTRQDGVDAATGEYLIHCDPDDWVEPDTYEAAYNEAISAGADMVMFDFFNSTMRPSTRKQYTNLSLLEDIAGAGKDYAHGGACNKLVRSAVAKAAKFPRGVAYCEDANVMFQILRNPVTVAYLRRPLYHYEANPNGVCRRMGREDLERDLINIRSLNDMKGGSERYDRCVDAYIFSIIYSHAFQALVHTNAEFRRIYGPYRHTVGAFVRCSAPARMCMSLAMAGLYRPSRWLFDVMLKIQRLIRK